MPQTLDNKPHLHQVDYIRAIASLAVALFHLGGKALPVLKFGWLGIYMFFLLSGFIICWAIPQNYTWRLSGKFIAKRIVRIEPPYIASIIVVLIVVFATVPHYQANWLNTVQHLAYLNNFTGEPYLSPVYWTLGIEFQYYIFIALCFPLIISKWGGWFLLALCGLPYLIDIPGATLANFFPVFALGILYYLYLTKKTSLLKSVLFGIPVLVCCWMRLGLFETCIVVLTLILLAVPLKRNGVVRFFANISFSLYLTHDAVGSHLVVWMGQHLPKTVFYKGIEFVSGIAVSILFAYIFYVLIEKPCLRLSKKIAYKPTISTT